MVSMLCLNRYKNLHLDKFDERNGSFQSVLLGVAVFRADVKHTKSGAYFVERRVGPTQC